MTVADDQAPLVVHIVHRFDYGGLENGLVNIINTMNPGRYRHAVVALTEATAFADRIDEGRASVHSLHKRPGKDPKSYLRLWSLLRRLKPAILHTRNIGTMDCVAIGRLAGVRACVHGEHGWDTHDPDGTVARYRRIRRVLAPFVTRFITVSRDLARWLTDVIGIPAGKVTAICNGVDTERFRPTENGERAGYPDAFRGEDVVIVGTVLRFQAIKDPLNLVRAWIEARRELPDIDLRLVMLGDGPLKAEAEALLQSAGVADACWLPGMRDDVPALMREFDIFVLPSKREGISNTVLEALASGLPVVATDTGGNPELVEDGACGRLVPVADAGALAAAIRDYAADADLRQQHARAARQRALDRFSLRGMADSYEAVYDAALNLAGH